MLHILAGEHIVSSETVPTLTRSLPALGSGVTRTAYDLGNGSVLKVQHGHTFSYSHGNQTEVSVWEKVKDSGYAEYFAEIIAYDPDNFAWIVQRKADRTATTSELDEFWQEIGYELDSEFGIGSDLHKGNLGVIEDSEGNAESYVIIDYAIAYHPSPTCECGNCECSSCNAGGECQCPTFAGHRERICWVSDCFGDAVFRIAIPTWFANKLSETQGACCREHKPIGHRTGKELRRIAGQGTLGI